MMDFITAPLIVWICISGVYSLFELFARRKERIMLIEKMGDKLDPSLLNGKLSLLNYTSKSFSGLKIGCLLVGLGLGLLVGLMINVGIISNGTTYTDDWGNRNVLEVAYSASVLFFGGVGLLISFMIENKMNKKDSQSLT